MIIGLSGYAQTGKDTVADIMGEQGWKRRAFADNIRASLYALNPLIKHGVRVQDIVSVIGWEPSKQTYPEIRRMLQVLGTEAGRNILGDRVWIDSLLSKMNPDHDYVITDCRYPNEADAIREAGGHIWRIERPGVGPLNDHASENSMDGYRFDARILNDGDLKDLRILVNSLLVSV